jgi:hypothetical protein
MPTPAQEAANTHTSPERLQELWLHSPKLGIIVASNENAPAELLQELAVSEDEQIRQAVCSNPNTPTDILFKLGEEFPQELFDNPVFSLLLLENPNLIEDIPESTLVSLLKSPSIPDSYLQWAIQSKRASILFAVVMNPKINKDDLQKLINNSQFYWWSQQISNITKLHVNWSSEMRSGWEEAAFSVVRKQQIFKDTIRNELLSEFSLWQMGVIPESFITALDPDTLLQIAQHPDTPGHILQTLLKNRKTATKKFRIAIANNLSTPPCILEQLANDKNITVRQNAFLNPQMPDAVFQRYHKHEASNENSQTPVTTDSDLSIETLLQIIEINQDENYYEGSHYIEKLCSKITLDLDISDKYFMRCALIDNIDLKIALARHPKTPISILETFLKSSSFRLRTLVPQNPNFPANLLIKLLKDKNWKTRKTALLALQKNPLVRRHDEALEKFWQQWEMAQNVETPAEILVELAQSQWVLIREAVALNPKTAMIVYKTKKKAKSPDKTNTPATLIEKLLVDKNPVVRVAVAKNPNTPVNILEQLANNIFYRHPIHIASVRNLLLRHPERAAVYIENCTKDSPEPSFSRFFVLLHPFISSKMLAKHFRSSSWLERYAIATNPNTPVHIRQRLAEDANRIVRAAAKSYLSK